MQSARAIVLIGALLAGGAVTAGVAAWWLGGDVPEPGALAPRADVDSEPNATAARQERSHVAATSTSDSAGADQSAPRIEHWLAGVCGDGKSLQGDDGLDVEWWDFPLDDVMAALFSVVERDGMDWSGSRAMEQMRNIGYLAAPWAPDVARYLGDSRHAPDAVLTLASMGPDALPVLREAAGSDDPEVRLHAMLALAEATYRRREIVELALAALRDEDPRVRLQAFEVLGAHDEAPELSVPALAERVSARDDATQREVMKSLYLNGPRAADAVPALMGLIADHRRRRAEDAVGVLEQIGPAAAPAVPTLLALIVNDPSTYSRSVPDAVSEISPDAFVAALSHEDPAVRAAFARVARSGRSDPESEARLLAALDTLLLDPDERVREEAIGAIDHLNVFNARTERELDVLRQRLERSTDLGARDRRLVLDSIARKGPRARDLASAVRERLHDTEPRVRLAAALAVWSIDPPAADVEPILRSLRVDPELRVELFVGLRQRPPATWTEFLVELLVSEPDSSVVIGTAYDLVAELGADALDALIRVAKSETRPERIAFLGALLYEIGEPAVPTLRELAARPGLLPPLRAQLLRYAEEAR